MSTRDDPLAGAGHLPYRDNADYLADELRRLDLLIRLRVETLREYGRAAPRAQASRSVYITPEEVDWLLTPAAGAVPQDEGPPDSEPPNSGPAAAGRSAGGRAAVTTEPAGGEEPDPAGEAPGESDALRAALGRLSDEIDERVERSLTAGVTLGLPTLGRLFGLSTMELQAVMVCLAPELRRAYDRLYAYLQDDITRQRPSVDLILELLCPHERQRWAARATFSEAAPLRRAGILRRVDDPASPSGSTGLAQFLALDPRVCRYLLGVDELDVRLAGRARLYRPASAPAAPEVDPEVVDGLVRLAGHHAGADRSDWRALVLPLSGPAGAGKRELARQVCERLGVALLSVDAAVGHPVAAGPAEDPPGTAPGALDTAPDWRLVFREALLHRAAVHVAGADALIRPGGPNGLDPLVTAAAELGWLVFLSGESAFADQGAVRGTAAGDVVVQPVVVPLPDVPRSVEIWHHALAGHTPDARHWAAELAARFRLTPGRIRAAVELAGNERLMRSPSRPLTLADVYAACRAQSSRKLGDLAVKVRPHCGWDDLVLPADRVAHLREICDQVRQQYRVFDGWGFGAKLSHGKGLSVLFSGPPGTGKTMAAEVLAGELELDLYKVDLSGVVDKYIGETEKNLGRIFDEAQASNGILFFDEADSVFGKRTEVSDAHDRYANIETSYLLQKIEEYEGTVILATNLRQNLDEAFTRRIRCVVEFPFPEADSRLRIWRGLFPREAPVSSDVDFAMLAREFPVTGGNIKNIVMNAAFLAAADGGTIGRRHILRGTRREYEKIGKLWSEPADTSALSEPGFEDSAQLSGIG
ncbi:ATP-binding protein [Rugosimonospora africana]|uniref:ATPase AAA n=1 Tax=Rugosimonospora africana TaxID=556532 RepID=A0A8J3QS87_9ACTN|nr:ATP-binding protein [Rugosimonospora africana]GIH14151.1 ATPase AAA [Rugosimonospora africana]